MDEFYSHIDELILSFLRDKITPAERAELMSWISEKPEHKEYFRNLYKLWNATSLANDDGMETEEVLQKIKFTINTRPSEIGEEAGIRHVFRSWMKWAAIILISFGSGAFIIHLSAKKSSLGMVYNEVVVPMGSRSTIHLPDGTMVILNAGSKLTYNMDYGQTLREVKLTGEGYFKVAKNKEVPFVVHTSKANIKALGTEFNVKAYPEENIIETILVEGSVVVNELSDIKDGKSVQPKEGVVLKPGEKLQIFKQPVQISRQEDNRDEENASTQKPVVRTTAVKVESPNPEIETSWKDKRWIIKSLDLENLAVLLSRRFNVNIKIQTPDLKKYKFSGTIENETLEQVFTIMKYTVPVSYNIDKGEVTWTINRNLEKDYKEAYRN